MRKRYLSAVCVVPLMLLVVTGCSRSQAERPAARCSAILSVGQKTYWDVQVDLSRGTRVYRRGDLSACSARISPRHHTGMFVTTYRLHGFDPNQALISPGGPGDPQTLWIATSGGKPPYTAPRKVQLIIDAHPGARVDAQGSELSDCREVEHALIGTSARIAAAPVGRPDPGIGKGVHSSDL